MTRREAIAVSAGTLLGLFVRPTPRRSINLLDFCGQECAKYDLRLPYVYQDWTFATDSILCVRVRPIGSDKSDHRGLIPPFEKLTFNHDRIRGWQSLPKLEPIIAQASNCPACDGYGRVGHQINWKDCTTCGGYGHQIVYSNSLGHNVEEKCKSCDGLGYPKSEKCRTCNGNAIGTLPGLVRLGTHYFDYGLYEKIRKLNPDYVLDYWNSSPSMPMMKFKFAEGDGMIMGVDQNSAMRRIKDAK